MRLVSRLAPPAAIATLAAAALAIPAAPARAEIMDCRATAAANVEYLMKKATLYAMAGDIKWFQRALDGANAGVAAYGKC